MNEEMTHSPRELLELAIGFQRSQVLFTFAELDIASRLEHEPRSAPQLAEDLQIDPLAMERFLHAAVAVGLLEKRGVQLQNTQLSRKYLIKNAPSYLGGQLQRYKARSRKQWIDLTDHLKNWDYGTNNDAAPEPDDQSAEAMAEQHNLAILHGQALAKSFDFSGFSHLLDLGGGTGAMSIALCREYPKLRSTIFDLPENVKKAEEFVTSSGAEDRIGTIGGNILEDQIPGDFDIALLANLLAVFDAETNIALFKKIYEKLPPGGAILISGWILDDDRLAPEISVLFCLEDICWGSPDVERNFGVYRSWLEAAGFREPSMKTYFEPTRLISALK